MPQAEEIGAEAEEVLVDRAMSHVLNVAYSRDVETRKQAAHHGPIRSLMQDAQRAGLQPSQLARVCELDLGILSKLNSRQIQPWTIPAELIRILAELLNKTTARLETYFAAPPVPPTGRAFLSRSKPTNTRQQSFTEAVRGSSLSNEKKARWLDQGTAAKG